MEIFLDKRAVRQIRVSVADAIEDGNTDTLREDLIEAFSDDDVEELERRIDSGDFYDFISEILDEWSGEDAAELFELLEAQLADVDIELKYGSPDGDTEEEEEEAEDEEEDEEEAEGEEEEEEFGLEEEESEEA